MVNNSFRIDLDHITQCVAINRLEQERWDGIWGDETPLLPTSVRNRIPLDKHPDKKEYRRQTTRFGKENGIHLKEAVLETAKRFGRFASGKFVQQWGPGGHCYDQKWWIPSALEVGFEPILLDISKVALSKARPFLRRVLAKRYSLLTIQERLVLADVVPLVESPVTMQSSTTAIIDCCRLIGLFEPEVMQSFLENIGKHFLRPDERNVLRLLHSFGDHEENQGLPGKTKHYTWEQVLAPLKKGLGRDVLVEHKRKIFYYDHAYTACAIRAS